MKSQRKGKKITTKQHTSHMLDEKKKKKERKKEMD